MGHHFPVFRANFIRRTDWHLQCLIRLSKRKGWATILNVEQRTPSIGAKKFNCRKSKSMTFKNTNSTASNGLLYDGPHFMASTLGLVLAIAAVLLWVIPTAILFYTRRLSAPTTTKRSLRLKQPFPQMNRLVSTT